MWRPVFREFPLPPGGGAAAGEGSNAETYAFLPSSGPFLMLALSGSRSARATFSRREKDSLAASSPNLDNSAPGGRGTSREKTDLFNAAGKREYRIDRISDFLDS